MSDPRWLDRDALAAYIAVRVDELPRYTRAGKLPAPSHHLGPRSPRWWSADVDEAFRGKAGSAPPGQKGQSLVEDILAGRVGRNAHRSQAAGRRDGQGISVPAQGRR
jgi:hypothetical protein